jgi:hypothetical protein
LIGVEAFGAAFYGLFCVVLGHVVLVTSWPVTIWAIHEKFVWSDPNR